MDSGQTEMELVEQGEEGTPQRIVVDSNNPEREVVDAKKPEVPQQIEKKSKIIMFVANAHYEILKAFKLDAHERNINLGDQIHNILFTAYIILRQIFNQTGGTSAQRLEETDYEVTFEGRKYTVTRGEVQAILIAKANEQGIPFRKYQQDDPLKWYGVATPLMNFLAGHALRRKELRLGHHVMPLTKRNNKEIVVKVAEYGIFRHHHVLCEGMSFPPEKRASMCQDLGPITILLCYIKAERRLASKWKSEVKRALGHMPGIDIILSGINEKDPCEIRTFINLFCDVALITTTRQFTRMFPPPAAFSYIFRRPMHKVANSTYKVETLLRTFNFSGHGAFAFYKIFQSINWSLHLVNGTESIAKQIVYHSMFGTYKQDLSLLSQVTNHAIWNTKEEMEEAFQISNTGETAINFSPVQQKYYPKSLQVNKTLLPTSSCGQVSSLPCFSGRTKRKFADAFFDDHIETSGMEIRERSLNNWVSSYAAIKEKLRVELEVKKRSINFGKLDWRKMEDITMELDGPADEEISFVTSGKSFLCRK